MKYTAGELFDKERYLLSSTDFAILRAWNLPSYATEVKLRHDDQSR